MVEIYFDGACEPFNPGGTVSFGYLIKKEGKTINQGSGIVGSGEGMTNNVGEYHGLIEGVKALLGLNLKEKIIIHGDSIVVCKVVSKDWGWKNKKKTVWDPHRKAPHLKKLLEETLELLKSLDYKIEWVPREKNQEADNLSKEPLIKAGIIKPETEQQKEKCPECNGYLVEREGKFGRFYGCSKFPKCRFTKKIS